MSARSPRGTTSIRTLPAILGGILGLLGGALAAFNSLAFSFLAFLVLDLATSTPLGLLSVLLGFLGVFLWFGMGGVALQALDEPRFAAGVLAGAAGRVFCQWAIWEAEFGAIRILSASQLLAAGILAFSGMLVIVGGRVRPSRAGRHRD